MMYPKGPKAYRYKYNPLKDWGILALAQDFRQKATPPLNLPRYYKAKEIEKSHWSQVL
jgi:hypothetical protein